MRSATINRKTTETDISLILNVDGTGESKIDTGCGFLDHMMTLFARHGGFDITLDCKGDTKVDYHHTAEDIGICLGKAIREAAADKRGIKRYADITLPMDESLVLCAVDISGRAGLYYAMDIPTEKVGDFDCELCEEFWAAFCREAQLTMHLRQICGRNSHHIIEAVFKASARALSSALSIDPRNANNVPSTKGTL